MTAATEHNFLIAGVVALSVAALSVYVPQFNRRSPAGPAIALSAAAVLMLALAIAVRWVRELQGPFLTLYDVLLSNLFSLVLLYLIVCGIAPRFRITLNIVLPFFVLLGLWLLTVPSDAVPLPPTFDNGWLWLHVTAGKVFLGLYLVVAAASALLLLDHFGFVGRSLRERLRPGELDASIWPVLALAFICHSFMLIAGAVWAQNAWGRYWAWDPLETWAFVTWLSLGLLMHARVTYRRMPLPLSWASAVAIFVLAFLTFFGVPFISLAPHKGVM